MMTILLRRRGGTGRERMQSGYLASNLSLEREMEKEDTDRKLFELARELVSALLLKKFPNNIEEPTDLYLWKQHSDYRSARIPLVLNAPPMLTSCLCSSYGAAAKEPSDPPARTPARSLHPSWPSVPSHSVPWSPSQTSEASSPSPRV